MYAYKYRGYSSDGDLVEGQLDAASTEEAERRLVAQDVTIVAILPAGARRAGRSLPSSEASKSRKKPISTAEGATLLSNLAIMAETGVPFVEALEAASKGARSPRLADLLGVVRDEVISGRSLSQAFRSADGLFPPLVADMINVAEEGGRLDHALKTAGAYLEREAELRKRVMNAMLYPLVMMSISAITVFVLIVIVMPRFASIFVRMDVDVPASTRLMLSAGEAIRNNPLAMVAGLVVAIAGFKLALRSKTSSRALSRLALATPILGDLLKKLAFSRAFGSLAALLGSNVPILDAITHSAKVAGVPDVRDGLMAARTSVENGRTLAEALGETNVVPPALLQMVSVGEKTGKLSKVMGTAAERMESEVDAKLKALVSIVEPVMIVVMGLIVGGITVSIIGPIYSVVQNIK